MGIGNSKVVIGPISREPLSILMTTSSEINDRHIDLLDRLAVIGKRVAPETFFRLHQSQNETYTVSKKDIYICLDSVGSDYNTLYYVFLHELTHCVATSSKHHDPIFSRTFQQLRMTAIHLGILDERKHVQNEIFCGTTVSY